MHSFIVSVLLLLQILTGHSERGIIIPIGPERIHFAGLYATIQMIRGEFKCNYPIEVWSYPDEILRMPNSTLKAFESMTKMNVFLRHLPIATDVHAGTAPRPEWDSAGDWTRDYIRFSSMPLALIHTKFDEVLAMDADCVLFVSPETIFNTRQYKDTGTLFLYDKVFEWWPHWYPAYDPHWMKNFMNNYDRSKFKSIASPKSQFAAPLPPHSFTDGKLYAPHMAESSLLLFDKTRQRKALAILEDLTLARGAEVFSHIYGDKETYWMSCALADTPYAFNDWSVAHWGRPLGHSNMSSYKTCPGDAYSEPGTLHYLPGDKSRVRIMSINECKSVGCVQFGMRKLHISPPIKRSDHVKRYKKSAGKTLTDPMRARVPIGNVNSLPIATKNGLNGRNSEAVKHYHKYWYLIEGCEAFPNEDMNTLMKHRQFMEEGWNMFCEDSSWCRARRKENRIEKKFKKRASDRGGVVPII